MYPFLKEDQYPSHARVNSDLQKLYGKYFSGLVAFAQDVFGNQLCFDESNGEVIFFQIEEAGRKYMAKKFTNWLVVLESDYDYYTGLSYLKEWQKENSLAEDQRISPKIPFVIGGDYTIDNFYAAAYPNFLDFNADLASQIYDAPDGTPVKWKFK